MSVARVLAGVLLPLFLAPVSARAADPATTHDPGLILVVDDRSIARQAGFERVFNRAVPAPVVALDAPATEADCAWGHVIREPDGRFRMWYGTLMMGQAGKGPHEMAAAGGWGRGDEFTFRPRSPADVRRAEPAWPAGVRRR